MRLHIGSIPESPDFVPTESWNPLREPSPIWMQLFALPLGIAAAAIVGTLWWQILPHEGLKFESTLPTFLWTFLGIVVVHELIHAAVHPGAGLSPQTVIGLWPSRLIFYAHYHGELPQRRFVAVFLAPIIFISFLPLAVAAVTGMSGPWIAFVSTFNALLACGDLFGAALLMAQVPRNAIVRNQGWYTYWKLPDQN